MGNRSTLQKFFVALSILANPWMLLLDKLGIVSKPQYTSRTGMSFFTRGKTTDINDAVVVLSGKEYPQELTGLNRGGFNGGAPVVLDCGGHIGSFTLYIKSHWPHAKVFAMEPVPDNQELFKKNMDQNKLSDVTMIPFALYGESGTFYIDMAGKQFDAVSVSNQKPEHNEFLTIHAKTLAEVVAENNISSIDLMKLDIEGAEYHIFEHSLPELGKYVRRIIMEFHPAGDKARRDQIVDRLCKDGPFTLIYETKNILGFDNDQNNIQI
jgi:FkbM family methyltransferase